MATTEDTREGTGRANADLYPKPAPDPTYKKQTAPGSVAQSLSKALMQGAFSKFGQAFTDTGDVKKDAATRDERMAPFNQGGGEVANALQGRWHTMEYENFQNEFIEPFIQSKKAMLDDYQRRHAQADEGIFEGPDGMPIQVDITKKEGRMKAIRMRGALEKRFYAINGDMDLELFNEAGKYSSNPMIVQRAQMIGASTSNTLATITSPEGTMAAEDKMSMIRGRENEAEARMVAARAQAQNVKTQKRPKSYGEAIKHADVGPGGIMQWFISDPDGLAILHSQGGGSSFVNAEMEIAKGALMASNPDLKEGDPVLESKLSRMEPEIVAKAAAKYLEHLDPKNAAVAEQLTPHFFAPKKEKERGIINAERQDPKVRKNNVDTWKKHAEAHLNEYFANPNNDPNIDAAMDNLDQWLRAAIYGDTDEPVLQAVTAARGPGTSRYVSEVLEAVPDHIKKWWHTKGGSGVAQEENPEAATQGRLLAGRGGRRGAQAARRRQSILDSKKGLLP